MLFNMFKGDGVRQIMNFAKASIYSIDNLKFDLWDFELKDNFSLLWSKFIQGSDLVILLFDLSNYHLRVINHFLDLQKKESKFSKLLIIGNKRDLVREEDMRIIKNELNIKNMEEISLIEVGAKEKIKNLISGVLNLKKLLPHNFTELYNEAKNVENEGNYVLAIAKYKEALITEPYSLIIMDLTVSGGMGGKEAITEILQIDPDVKAIVSSGYSNDPVMASYESYGFKGVLVKPYTINQLRKAIIEILNN